jgi:Flp pilus assembly protein TadG
MTTLAEGSATNRTPLRSLMRRFLARACDLRADTSGVAAVVAAIVFPIVVGGMGLGAETGYWYMTQRKLQHAADLSAVAGGARLRAGDSNAQIAAAATNIARNSGLSASVGTIVVNTPPVGGASAGQGKSVQVILTEVRPRSFSSVFSTTPVTINTRAVAKYSNGSQACVLALSPVASGAVTVTGATNVALQNCDVASDSNAADSFLMSGAAVMSAGCVDAVGHAVTTSQLTLTQCAAARVEAPVVRDPYASVAEPSAIGACSSNVGKTNTQTTLTPTDNQPNGVKSMRFCGGAAFKGTVTFNPGLYIIDGGSVTANGNVILCTPPLCPPPAPPVPLPVPSGVTFYFANGAHLQLGSNASLYLAAPTSGPYSGILFFGSRTSAGAAQQFGGGAVSQLEGAIYMPASDVTFTGNSPSNGCTQVIGRTVTLTGGSSLGSNCGPSSGTGTSIIATNETVAITE